MFQHYERRKNFRLVLLDGIIVRMGRALFNLIPWQIRFRLPYRSYGRWLNKNDVARISGATDVHYTPHCPTSIFPFPAIASLYSLHDLQHVQYPQFFTAREIVERDAAFGSTVAQNPLVQVSSAQMAKEFEDHFPTLGSSDLVLIPEGVDVAQYASAPRDDVRHRHNLPERFLFYPAQLWPHKDHMTLLKAVSLLRDNGVHAPLVLTGGRYPGSADVIRFIEQNGERLGIFYLGTISRADIIALYHSARALVTTSLYESSSIPILEAAASGTAIIASAIPAHLEQAQHLQMQTFSPADPLALAALIGKIWNDDELVERQVEYNRKAVLAFSWEKIAEQYLQTFERMGR